MIEENTKKLDALVKALKGNPSAFVDIVTHKMEQELLDIKEGVRFSGSSCHSLCYEVRTEAEEMAKEEATTLDDLCSHDFTVKHENETYYITIY